MSTPSSFIHDDLQLKMLILYLLNRVIKPITFDQILQMAMYLDKGVDYFSLTQAVAHMVETGQLSRDGDLYLITEKGKRNSAICDENLPYSIRKHCDENLLEINDELKTADQIRTEVQPLEDGTCLLHLWFSDGTSPLLELKLLTSSLSEGNQMALRFRRDPASLYYAVVERLISKEDESI